MSTKITISYNDDYHFYEECYDTDNVYLQLKVKDWSFNGEELTLSVPIDFWRKIAHDWNESSWGQNPYRDHYRESKQDFDNYLQALEELSRIKIENEENK